MSALALTREVRAVFGEPRRMTILWPILRDARKSALLRMTLNLERAHLTALYLINPASLGSVRLISGMQMISSSPANSASIYGT